MLIVCTSRPLTFAFRVAAHDMTVRPYLAALLVQGNTANVYHGIVARPAAGSRGHVALDKLSTKGDSGGGIFSAATGQLLGMMVGRDQEREISYMVPAAVLLAATAEVRYLPSTLLLGLRHYRSRNALGCYMPVCAAFLAFPACAGTTN